jgi:hypothetical protein
VQADDPAADRLHDAPAAQDGASGQGDGARDGGPRRRRELVDAAVGDEQRRDHADRLLRVI